MKRPADRPTLVSTQKRGLAAVRALALSLVLGWTGAVGCATDGIDPYQGMNENIHAFNEGVDNLILAPVATGWDFVLPDFVQTGVGNFFGNLRMLRTTLNDLLQGKPGRSGIDFARFGINTTLGIVGLVDVATLMEIPHYEEDFGQTLGVWGFGPGPYLVIPFFGPSSGRDFAAFPVDTMTVPTAYGVNIIDIVNTRAKYLEEIDENRRTAFDYYVFVRNAYLQNRAVRVEDGELTLEEDEDDFYFDDDDEDLELDENGAALEGGDNDGYPTDSHE